MEGGTHQLMLLLPLQYITQIVPGHNQKSDNMSKLSSLVHFHEPDSSQDFTRTVSLCYRDSNVPSDWPNVSMWHVKTK